MAWRIHKQVIRGEIDNRFRDRITGRLWLVGSDEPLVLDLEGNPWRDLAGHLLRFSQPDPQPGERDGLQPLQAGVVGDLTASRKVKVPECSVEELRELTAAGQSFPWHWGNALYLEWFSEANGRVVLESTDFQLELVSTPTWEMSAEEESEQRHANALALTNFMDRLVTASTPAPVLSDPDSDDDSPQSAAEAEADEEAARMDLLLDRVTARMDREELNEESFERILDEERARLKRERGEDPEPELTPEEEQEHAEWIAEMNAACEEAAAEVESEKWKGEEAQREQPHPLQERCHELAVQVHHAIEEGGWLPDDPHREHPLIAVVTGTMSASAKLAGALGMADDGEWPPDPLIAGNTLVRLKKARDYLRDVLRGLDSADEEELATIDWRTKTRHEISEILGEVQELIQSVRRVLGDEEG